MQDLDKKTVFLINFEYNCTLISGVRFAEFVQLLVPNFRLIFWSHRIWVKDPAAYDKLIVFGQYKYAFEIDDFSKP